MSDEMGLARLLRSRIGVEFDGEAHLTEAEAQSIAAAIERLVAELARLHNGEDAILPHTKRHAEHLYIVATAAMKSYGVDVETALARAEAERDEAREALKLMQPLGAVPLPQAGEPSVRLRDIFPADFAAVDAVLAGRARKALGGT